MREREIVTLLAEDCSGREIAEMLQIGVPTVATYRRRIMKKLGIQHPNGIVKYAVRKGWISLGT